MTIVRLILLFGMGLFFNPAAMAQPPEKIFCVGFSSNLFTSLNKNDATAAMKVWTETAAREQGMRMKPMALLLNDMDALFQTLQKKQTDVVGITAMEYYKLSQKIQFSPLLIAENRGDITEAYVLLSHKDGNIKSVADLKGRLLAFQNDVRTCLAPLWLDTLLFRQGHPPADRFTKKILYEGSPEKTVLPVFFGQTDACVIKSRTFDIMAELNPQLAAKLIPVAQSPGLIPAVLAFRADYDSVLKEKLTTGITKLKHSPAGRQTLTIFQCDDIKKKSVDCLDTTLAMIETYNDLVKLPPQP